MNYFQKMSVTFQQNERKIKKQTIKKKTIKKKTILEINCCILDTLVSLITILCRTNSSIYLIALLLLLSFPHNSLSAIYRLVTMNVRRVFFFFYNLFSPGICMLDTYIFNNQILARTI